MYDRRTIMTAAWSKHNRFGVPFAAALRLAWYEAKKLRPVHQVWGDAFHLAGPVMIAGGLTYEQACRVQFQNQYRFDRITITAA